MTPAAPAAHVSVMLDEVVEALNPRAGALYVDGTFGAGGYARALLDAAECRVLGIDRDPAACARGAEMAAGYDGRLTVLCGRFGEMDALLGARGLTAVDGVAHDVGVSSMQLDEAERGFSFRADGPLDMRMGADGPTAADIVNSESEEALADIIYEYGEERRARRIARAICRAREAEPITRTLQLAGIVRGCFPPPRRQDAAPIDPATRTFQALRIRVNDELGELDRGLESAEALLVPGGRLAVVSFHSLEDRRVKEFISLRSGNAPRPSRHAPDTGEAGRAATFIQLHRRVRRPDEDEIAANPRARSARLRAAERTDAPAWPRGAAGATS